MRIRRYRNYINLKIFICALLVISVTAVTFYVKMRPVIFKYAVSKAETLMLDSANKAVVNVLEDTGITYDDIVILTSNGEGYITSLEIDVYKINHLKSLISNKISEMLDSREYYAFNIPFGSFFGDTYISGIGPRIKFKMQLTATAFADFEHEFKSAGINQVLHIITVNIKIKGNIIIAGYNKSIVINTSAIAAQTVIVGKSPEAFTNVVEGTGGELGGIINDYGAVAGK